MMTIDVNQGRIDIKLYKNIIVYDYLKYVLDWKIRAFGEENIDRQEIVDQVNNFANSIKFMHGRKYIKVVVNGGAHSFIVMWGGNFKRGSLLKAASFSSPNQKYCMGNIITLEGVENIRWTGL
jgi:hypothetical protein